MGKEKQQIRHWNNVAADYCLRQKECTSIYQPVVEKLLGDVSGRRVLDAGCVVEITRETLFREVRL